jgi:signal peptidase II
MTTDHNQDERDAAEVSDDEAAEVESARPAGARWSLMLTVAAVALALDQATKAWAVSALDGGRVIELVGSLQLQLTRNSGAAFSIGNGRGPLISLLALGVVAVLLRTSRHAAGRPMAVALGLVLGGAFGNLIDRAFRTDDGFLGGAVIDFIDLQWWPVFNLADSAVVVGAILLFLVQWRDTEPESESPPSTP